MKTIIFQGDSITDCGRSRENFDWIGEGYPVLVPLQERFDEVAKNVRSEY